MSVLRMKKDGSGIGGGSGASADATKVAIPHENTNEILACAILALLDEINALRTLGLIGLAAKTPEDIKTAIDGKLAG